LKAVYLPSPLVSQSKTTPNGVVFCLTDTAQNRAHKPALHRMLRPPALRFASAYGDDSDAQALIRKPLTVYKVFPDQPLRIPAKAYNAFVDATKTFKATRTSRQAEGGAMPDTTKPIIRRDKLGGVIHHCQRAASFTSFS
jgi:hypothetical protein